MNRKALFLVIFGLVIMTALFLVISVWAYQEYFNKKNLPAYIVEKSTPKKDVRDTTLLSVSSNPENNAVTTSGINEMDTTQTLEEKIIEYVRLKNELAANTANKKNPSDSIQEKITYLENNIRELKSNNEKVAAENKKLGQIIRQLAGNKQKVTKSPPLKKTITTTATAKESKSLNISNISLRPYSDGNLSSNLSASNAEGLQGSFLVKNIAHTSGVFNIVLLLPDGKVLRQSGWETGIFNTPSGKKVYTTQVHLNEDSETMQFTVKSATLTDGIYTLQIYYDGKMVGQLRKRLG